MCRPLFLMVCTHSLCGEKQLTWQKHNTNCNRISCTHGPDHCFGSLVSKTTYTNRTESGLLNTQCSELSNLCRFAKHICMIPCRTNFNTIFQEIMSSRWERSEWWADTVTGLFICLATNRSLSPLSEPFFFFFFFFCQIWCTLPLAYNNFGVRLVPITRSKQLAPIPYHLN